MPSSHRSGLSATVGLLLVVGLLVVAGSLAVSGGGILSTGGRLGVPVASPTPAPAGSGTPVDGGITTATGTDGDVDASPEETDLSTKLDYTCDAGAIKDVSRRKWFMSQFSAGSRISDGYDQVAFELSQAGKAKAKKATVVRMEWLDPNDAKSKYGAPGRVQGSRALVLSFNGPVNVTANQALDSLLLERESMDQVRNIQMFEGADGSVHAIIGLRSDSCARLEGKGWGKKAKGKNAKVLLQIERFE